MRKQGSCLEQCQVHDGEEDHARPGWTTSRRGQDSTRNSQPEWQRSGINGETTSTCGQPYRGRLKNSTEQFYSAALLLAMQSAVIPTAIPSVRLSHAGTLPRQKKRRSCDLHSEVAKHSSFMTLRMVGGRRPFPPKIFAQGDRPTPSEKNVEFDQCL